VYKKIMIPLDGSRYSKAFLPYARRVAESMNLSVELFHAIDQTTIDAFVDSAHGRWGGGR
jgi:nucleotide-binding universal stress UspA family protein